MFCQFCNEASYCLCDLESWVAVSREHVADVDYEEGRLSTASSDESSVEEQLAEAVEENVENERQTSGFVRLSRLVLQTSELNYIAMQ